MQSATPDKWRVFEKLRDTLRELPAWEQESTERFMSDQLHKSLRSREERKQFLEYLAEQDIGLTFNAEWILGASEKEHPPERPKGEKKSSLEMMEERQWTAAALLAADFPEPKWIIVAVLAYGLTVLAGAPKLGKSWMALALCVAVSSGGFAFSSIRVDKRGALYLALEDTPKRLQQRLRLMKAEPADNLHVFTEWPRGPKAIEALETWLDAHPGIELVIVDTLQKIRAVKQQTGQNAYESDYDEIAELKRLADQREISLIVVTHTRKQAADDYLHTVSGSAALTGAADAVWVFSRSRGTAEAKLSITGRDIDEQELAMSFDRDTGTWRLLGDAGEVQLSRDRQTIYDVLKAADRPLSPKEIAEEIGKPNNSNLRHTLRRMLNDEAIVQPDHAVYSTPQPSPLKEKDFTSFSLDTDSQATHTSQATQGDRESDVVTVTDPPIGELSDVVTPVTPRQGDTDGDDSADSDLFMEDYPDE